MRWIAALDRDRAASADQSFVCRPLAVFVMHHEAGIAMCAQQPIPAQLTASRTARFGAEPYKSLLVPLRRRFECTTTNCIQSVACAGIHAPGSTPLPES